LPRTATSKRIRELVDAHPALARAAYDWGFGDWEDCLGAASHVGNREIAEYLIANGARPTVFSATMLGQLDAVKAFIVAQPGVQRIPGPHSIPLLAHARAGGAAAAAVYSYLEGLGDAGAPKTNRSQMRRRRRWWVRTCSAAARPIASTSRSIKGR
jgi:hypothetical protein